jgi:hypothetical protein
MITCLEFKNQIGKSLGFDELRIGRHFLRAPNRVKIGERWITRLWYSHIQVGCEDEAVIAVIEFRDVAACRVCFSSVSEGKLSEPILTEIPAKRVMLNFDGINLTDATGGLSLDGVSYSVGIETIALRAFVEFSNPLDKRLQMVERDIVSVIQTVSTTNRGSVAERYCELIQSCIDSRGPTE